MVALACSDLQNPSRINMVVFLLHHSVSSKWIVERPFPAEHPYNSHIPRFALFPNSDSQPQKTKRSVSAPLQSSVSVGSCDVTNNGGGAISLPKPAIVESKTTGKMMID
jgi:hypothetical protein